MDVTFLCKPRQNITQGHFHFFFGRVMLLVISLFVLLSECVHWFVCGQIAESGDGLLPVIRELLARVQHLESHGRHQQIVNDALQSEVQTYQRRTAALEVKLEDLKAELGAAQRSSQEVGNTDGHEQENTSASSTNQVKVAPVPYEETSGPVKRAQITRQVDSDAKIAFYAALSGHLMHLGVKQNIAFDHVITNVGGAYNPHAGLFVAPETGVYVFSVTLMAYEHHATHLSMSKNGTPVSYIQVRGIEGPYDVSSQTAILSLQKGDDVAIQNIDADEALFGGNYSTFSGFLLYQNYSSAPVVG